MNILAIGAHFDDVEIGCGGALVKLKKAGHKVHLFVATVSEFTGAEGGMIRSGEIAGQEGRAAAAWLGANLVEAGLPTFSLQCDESLNRPLAQMVEQVWPDLVFTHWTGDATHDHLALARASLHCVRHIPKVLAYRSNSYSGSRPFDPRHFVEITQELDEKIALVKIYRSEFQRNQGLWEEQIRAEAVRNGRTAGVPFAEGFEVIRWVET